MAGDACPVPGPSVGEWIEVQWPCQSDTEAVAFLWFRALVKEASDPKENGKQKFLLRFEDAEETWNSLRKVQWRSLAKCEATEATEATHETIKAAVVDETVPDETGFVYSFEIEEDFLLFCDSLHARREELGDKSRGDCAYGEALSGGLVSVLIRREALPESEREVYNRCLDEEQLPWMVHLAGNLYVELAGGLHQRCIHEVSRAWPGWIQRAAGKAGKARPSQDLRVLQYFEKANFKAHVDSGWACQALIYLNEDFQGGYTEFPNLKARYQPRRGRVLLWRSVCVGFKPAVPGSMDDHPARHVACEVFNGVKRVVSLHLVLA